MSLTTEAQPWHYTDIFFWYKHSWSLDPTLLYACGIRSTLHYLVRFTVVYVYRCHMSRAQPRFNNWGVHFTRLSLQTSNYSGQRGREEKNEEGCPPPSRLESLGERRKLIQRGLGPQTISGRFVCNFIRFYAFLSAFNSCLEMKVSYIPVLASKVWRFPLTFLWCRTPQPRSWIPCWLCFISWAIN